MALLRLDASLLEVKLMTFLAEPPKVVTATRVPSIPIPPMIAVTDLTKDNIFGQFSDPIESEESIRKARSSLSQPVHNPVK